MILPARELRAGDVLWLPDVRRSWPWLALSVEGWGSEPSYTARLLDLETGHGATVVLRAQDDLRVERAGRP